MRAAIEVATDAAACARAAAARCAAAAAQAQAARGAFHLALAGGRTPRAVHAALARLPLDWSRIHIYWGDERAVPPDSPESNYAMARTSLLDQVPIEAAAIHRLQADRTDLERAARDYENLLLAHLGTPPRFDFIFLGLGPDAHTASLFPHSEVLLETQRFVGATTHAPIAPRLTLTFPTFAAAREVLFVVTGSDKAGAVAAVHSARRDVSRLPAQGVVGAHVSWLVDRDAAAELDKTSPPA